MIELTPEQQQALETHNGGPVIVYDPRSGNRYILMPTEEYDTSTGAMVTIPTGDGYTSMSPMMLRSQQAFWRDLPELLQSRRNRDKWVAYHGDERIGIAKTKTDLYLICVGRGLHPGHFYIGKIYDKKEPPWVLPALKEPPYGFMDEPSSPPTDS